MSLPTQSLTHVSDALALLTRLYSGKPVVEGLLSAYTAEVQALENAVWGVINGRLLATATNAQLDAIGRIVQEKRLGRDDTHYRAALRVRIRVLRSRGRVQDLLDVAALLSSTTTYLEYPQLAFEVSSYNSQIAPEEIGAYTSCKAATSYGALLSSTWAEANVFKWDHAGRGSPVNVWPSAHSTTIDKRWPAAYPTSPKYVYRASSGIDSSGLALTGLYRASYAGAPWLPSSSAGISSTNGNLIAGVAPSVGSLVNTYAPATFNGTTQYLVAANGTTSFVGLAAGTLIGLVKLPSSPVAPGTVTAEPAIFSDAGGSLQITATSAGIRAAIFDTAYRTSTPIAFTPGAWALVGVSWNSTGMYVRVGSVGAAPVTAAAINALSTLRVGSNYSGSAFLNFSALEILASTSCLFTDTSYGVFDQLRTGLGARYLLSL